ncbi:hypothetical protein PTKIN_Ptkin10aG0035600 [Pterospermum kingtungense]
MGDTPTEAKIIGRLQTIEQNFGKTYNQIAEKTGLTNVHVAQLKLEIALKLLTALPDLPEELLYEMMKPHLHSYDPNLIQEPIVYQVILLLR